MLESHEKMNAKYIKVNTKYSNLQIQFFWCIYVAFKIFHHEVICYLELNGKALENKSLIHTGDECTKERNLDTGPRQSTVEIYWLGGSRTKIPFSADGI